MSEKKYIVLNTHPNGGHGKIMTNFHPCGKYAIHFREVDPDQRRAWSQGDIQCSLPDNSIYRGGCCVSVENTYQMSNSPSSNNKWIRVLPSTSEQPVKHEPGDMVECLYDKEWVGEGTFGWESRIKQVGKRGKFCMCVGMLCGLEAASVSLDYNWPVRSLKLIKSAASKQEEWTPIQKQDVRDALQSAAAQFFQPKSEAALTAKYDAERAAKGPIEQEPEVVLSCHTDGDNKREIDILHARQQIVYWTMVLDCAVRGVEVKK